MAIPLATLSAHPAGDANNQVTAAKITDPAVSTIPYQQLWETTTTDAIEGSASVAAAASSYQTAPA